MSTDSPTPPDRGSAVSWPAVLATVSLIVTLGLWYQTRTELASIRIAQQDITRELRGSRDAPVLDVTGAPVKGSPDAIVTLIEFADYECPFCIRHFTETMPRIDAAYVATGKVQYIFRDFPIDSLHPGAIRAHEAAHCASEQGRFWDLHGRLFSAPGSHTDAALDARATEAGLDLPAFRACLASGRTTAAIRQSVDAVVKLGANGTPVFFIGLRDRGTNEVRVVQAVAGAQPYDAFAKILDAVVASAHAS